MVKQKAAKEKVSNKVYYQWTYNSSIPKEELCNTLAQRTNLALEALSKTRKYKNLCQTLNCTDIKLEFSLPIKISNCVYCSVVLMTPKGHRYTNKGMEVFTSLDCLVIRPINEGGGVKLFPDNVYKMLEIVLLGKPWI